ncbi:GntR family transcriptional regulator [Georgenia sp. Z1491]|uniref:GntR family transcriptional regulator n=1 Tax=Georgenia sp. Z1491 TaxID=3416707 RepID=UPI003CF8070B
MSGRTGAADDDLVVRLGGTELTLAQLSTFILSRSLQVSASPSAQDIAVTIARQIIEGDLPPSTDLNSVGIAERFGTSRSPVRDALGALERSGLVVVPPRRRPTVRTSSIEEIREIYEMRALLYGSAAQHFVDRARPEHVETMHRIHARMAEAAERGDLTTTLWLNVAFRETELDGADNALLKELHDVIALRAMILRRRGLTADRLGRSHFDHGRLILAYEEDDVPTARALSRSIVMRGLASLETLAEEGEEGDGDDRDTQRLA